MYCPVVSLSITDFSLRRLLAIAGQIIGFIKEHCNLAFIQERGDGNYLECMITWKIKYKEIKDGLFYLYVFLLSVVELFPFIL